jgi:lambda repressor-like predicted transcriptional regulator
MKDADLILKLETEIRNSGSMRKWARENDFSPSYISDALNGRRPVAERLAAALGYEAVRTWRKKCN